MLAPTRAAMRTRADLGGRGAQRDVGRLVRGDGSRASIPVTRGHCGALQVAGLDLLGARALDPGLGESLREAELVACWLLHDRSSACWTTPHDRLPRRPSTTSPVRASVLVPSSSGTFLSGNHKSHCAASPASHVNRSAGSTGRCAGRSRRTLSRSQVIDPVQPTRSAITAAGKPTDQRPVLQRDDSPIVVSVRLSSVATVQSSGVVDAPGRFLLVGTGLVLTTSASTWQDFGRW